MTVPRLPTVSDVWAGAVRHALLLLFITVAIVAVGRSCAVERDRDAQLAAGRAKLKVADSLLVVARQQRAAAEIARDQERVTRMRERTVRDSIWRVANARRDEARRWREVVESLRLTSVVDTMPAPAQIVYYKDEINRLTIAGDAVAAELAATKVQLAEYRESDLRERARADSLQAVQDSIRAEERLTLDTAQAVVRDAAKTLKRPWYKKTASVAVNAGERLLWFVAGRKSARVLP